MSHKIVLEQYLPSRLDEAILSHWLGAPKKNNKSTVHHVGYQYSVSFFVALALSRLWVESTSGHRIMFKKIN